jgi:hypothetical protein
VLARARHGFNGRSLHTAAARSTSSQYFFHEITITVELQQLYGFGAFASCASAIVADARRKAKNFVSPERQNRSS